MKVSPAPVLCAAFAAALFAAAPARAVPPPIIAPLPPAIHPEPDLLTKEERRAASVELARLTMELRAVRAAAGANPAILHLEERLRIAAANGSPESAVAALRRETEEARARLIAETPGAQEKQARTEALGRMLRYDSKMNKNLRRRRGDAFKNPRAAAAQPEVAE